MWARYPLLLEAQREAVGRHVGTGQLVTSSLRRRAASATRTAPHAGRPWPSAGSVAPLSPLYFEARYP
jgi:hypothetical protein